MAHDVTRRLQLLGPVCVGRIPKAKKNTAERRDAGQIGGGVPRFRSRRTIGILGYLIVEQRSIGRDFLTALFWPDETSSKGRGNLRRELHNLTQILPNCWELDRQSVTFIHSPGTSIDIYTLLQCNVEERWDEAVELLSGEFLEGLHLDDNLEFENWLMEERQRWRGISQTVLTQVIEGQTRRGHYADALRHTQRLLQIAPWNENAHRRSMRLLSWTGQRGAALRQFESCKRSLRKELEVEPAVETITLYKQIQTGELSLPPQLPTFLTEEKARHEYQHPRFVGRESELGKLDSFFAEVLKGETQVVFVSGGPGRGKTVLLEVFSQGAMALQPNLLVARGSCSAYSGVGDPYLPFRDVMAMLTGELEARWDAGAITSDHARRLWAAFSEVVQVILEDGPHLLDVFVPSEPLLTRAIMSGEDNAPWIPRLREIVHHNRTGMVDVDQSFLFQQFTQVLVSLTVHHPLLLILDDVQWGDAASISLLFHLGRRLAETGSRILIACAYRPEEVSFIHMGERHPLASVISEFRRTFGDIWVDLGRYDKVDDRRFVDALLDYEPNRLRERFRKALFERTSGHPLFTVELLLAMQDRGGLLKDSAGSWIAGPDLDWETLPTRVEAVIGDRIDRLNPELQEILCIASVEGEVFTAQILAEIQNVSERTLINQLSQELERRHRLVVEQEEVDTGQGRTSRYKFSHILFQDYLYKRLGRGERRLFHGAVAAALEKLYQGQLDRMAVQLAHHYQKAGDPRNAYKYFMLAGMRSARMYDSKEAIKHYTFAIELAEKVSPSVNSLLSLFRGRGLAYDRLGEFKHASTDLSTTLQIANEAGDEGVAWQVTIDLGKLWTSRDYNRAREYFESSLEIARKTREPTLLGASLNWMGNWHANDANPVLAIEHHQEALYIFEDIEEKGDLANTLDLLALASMLGGDIPAAVHYYNRAIPLFRSLSDRSRLASSLIGRANTVVSMVWLASVPSIPAPDVFCDAQEGLRIAGENGLTSEETWGYYSMGLLYLVDGHFDQAMGYMDKGLDVATGVGHREYEVGNRFALGILYYTLFSPQQALEQLELALTLAQELRSQTWKHIIYGELASVYMLLDDQDAAQSCLDAAISFDSPMDTLGRRYCWVRRAELALMKGDPKRALDIANRLIASAPGMTPESVIPYLWNLKGDALGALGEIEKACVFLQAAIRTAELTGDRLHLWRYHASLGHLYRCSGRQEAADNAFSVARGLINGLGDTIPDEASERTFREAAQNFLNRESLG